MNNNGNSKSEYTPLNLQQTEENNDSSGTLDAYVVNRLRATPEAWLPDPDDENSWTHFVSSAEADAVVLGIDLDAIIAEANENVLQEWKTSASPRAARAALGDYLNKCRLSKKITWSSVSEIMPGVSSQDVRQWEDKNNSLYLNIENREILFVAWVRCIEARWTRILRLIRCSSFPPEWQEIGDGPRIVYSPAGVSSEKTEYPLPRRAQNIVERLEAAWEEGR